MTAVDDLGVRERAVWTLWSDWCAAVDEPTMPTPPAVLARFIAANPAAPRTQRRRVAVINGVHRRAGHHPPGIAETVREAIDTARAARRRDLAAVAADVAAHLPDGWPAALFARRDALLLVLATSGIGPTELGRLTVGQVYADGEADRLHITTGREQFSTATDLVAMDVSPTVVLEEWLRLRALQHHIPSPSITATALRGSPTPAVPALPDDAPMVTLLDGWGVPPTDTTAALSASAIGALLRAHLAGGAPAHRHIAPRPAPQREPEPDEYPAPAPLDPRTWDRGLAARRAAQSALAHVDDVLEAVDARAGQLLEDLLQLLDDATTD
ncbi:recombinase [Tsukamurella columbiensis]|uniref:Recombinase n=1 Tax=Tsukamurella columbiensis TaxID=128509 RepID=A0ABX1LKK7_9ACTN|nr:recombinase [Tsukamurella columbiensis]NMD58015.1 recombinase [Tsukamurella columbiensis]